MLPLLNSPAARPSPLQQFASADHDHDLRQPRMKKLLPQGRMGSRIEGQLPQAMMTMMGYNVPVIATRIRSRPGISTLGNNGSRGSSSSRASDITPGTLRHPQIIPTNHRKKRRETVHIARVGGRRHPEKCGYHVKIALHSKRNPEISCHSQSSETVGNSNGEDWVKDCSGTKSKLAEKVGGRKGGEEGGGGEGEGGVKNVGRRRALALSMATAAPFLGSIGIGIGESSSFSNSAARALMQTGLERGEQKAATSAFDNLKRRVSTFTLENGMRWVVLERHQAPVVACHTYANVGASCETKGMTGLAHFLEHLAFKGTKLVGTRNPDKEASLLDQLDDVFYALQDSKMEGRGWDKEQLNNKFVELQAAAAKLSIPNEYGSLIERQGGIGLNAQTSQDSTEYFVSLPANKLELWMALESGRFIAPVFRELYSEKEVIKEERRLRVDNTPFGRFTEAFSETAFPQLPYGRPVIGYPDDFERLGRREVAKFFKTNYTPRSLTCAVVGDVDPAEVEKLAKRYFESWKAPNSSTPVGVVSPTGETWRQSTGWDSIIRPPEGQRTLRLNLSSQPLYMEGYYRPPASSSDDPALTVVNELLAGGRSSRFYKRVILPGKALSAQSTESFPGDKQPCLLLLYAIPPPGTSTDGLAGVLHKELEDLVVKNVTEDELLPIKKYARASLLEAFGSNRAMARLLCTFQATTSRWDTLLEENELVEQVSPVEVQRAASLLFSPSNRVTGHVVNSS